MPNQESVYEDTRQTEGEIRVAVVICLIIHLEKTTGDDTVDEAKLHGIWQEVVNLMKREGLSVSWLIQDVSSKTWKLLSEALWELRAARFLRRGDSNHRDLLASSITPHEATNFLKNYPEVNVVVEKIFPEVLVLYQKAIPAYKLPVR